MAVAFFARKSHLKMDRYYFQVMEADKCCSNQFKGITDFTYAFLCANLKTDGIVIINNMVAFEL